MGKHAKFIGTPTPPFAMLKEAPEFPADREYRQQMTVASGILQSDGKLEQITVRQGREHQQLAEPLIEALQHWLFEPGRINGKPVALKILLGIRLREKDEAFAWLQKTYQGHSSLMVSLKVDPVFDPVRGDSRFQQLLRTSVSPSRTNSRIVASLDLEFHAKIAK